MQARSPVLGRAEGVHSPPQTNAGYSPAALVTFHRQVSPELLLGGFPSLVLEEQGMSSLSPQIFSAVLIAINKRLGFFFVV